MDDITDVEPVMQKLLLVLQEANIDPPFKTITRVWQPWDQLSKLAQPALVLVEPFETWAQRRAQQPKAILNVQILIYAQGNNSDELNPPISVLNNLILGVRTALAPSGSGVARNVQDLGGLVSNCVVEGRIRKDPGVLDGQMTALIPVTITIP